MVNFEVPSVSFSEEEKNAVPLWETTKDMLAKAIVV